MGGELRDLAGGAAAVNGCLPDVEVAGLFAEVVILLRARRENGIAVFALETGEAGELSFGVQAESALAVAVEPDVARDGGSMMLAQRVFVALVVLIEDRSVGGDTEGGQGQGCEGLRLAAGQGDPVELGVAGEAGGLRVDLDVGAVDQRPVGEGGEGRLGALPGGQLGGGPAGGRCDPDVFAAFPVGTEYQLFAVCAPDGVCLMVGGGGNLPGLAAGGVDRENVALVAEGNGLSVG